MAWFHKLNLAGLGVQSLNLAGSGVHNLNLVGFEVHLSRFLDYEKKLMTIFMHRTDYINPSYVKQKTRIL